MGTQTAASPSSSLARKTPRAMNATARAIAAPGTRPGECNECFDDFSEGCCEAARDVVCCAFSCEGNDLFVELTGECRLTKGARVGRVDVSAFAFVRQTVQNNR